MMVNKKEKIKCKMREKGNRDEEGESSFELVIFEIRTAKEGINRNLQRF